MVSIGLYGFREHPEKRLGLLPAAQEHILAQEDGKDRLLRAVRELSQAFALSIPHEQALRIRDDVAFFQAVRAVIAKRAPGQAKPKRKLNSLYGKSSPERWLPKKWSTSSLPRPEKARHFNSFRRIPRRDKGCPSGTWPSNCCGNSYPGKSRPDAARMWFSRVPSPRCWNNPSDAIRTGRLSRTVIEELISLAKQMRKADQRGEDLKLNEDELAFYDALETNDSAVKVLGIKRYDP